MGDINRFLILLILVGLLFALYKYQDTIFENLDSLQSSMSSTLLCSNPTTTSVPTLSQLQPQSQSQSQLQSQLQLQLLQNPGESSKLPTKKEDKITADNISQISILSLNDKNKFDMNSLSNSDNISIILDDDTCDTRMSKQTYGSLFDD